MSNINIITKLMNDYETQNKRCEVHLLKALLELEKSAYAVTQNHANDPNPTQTPTPTSNLKKAKKIKDPNHVKKVNSPYIFYSNDIRSVIQAEQPNLTPKEVMTEVGARWNKIKNDSTATAKWRKLSDDDKQRYEREQNNMIFGSSDTED